MTRRYHTLLIRADATSPWAPDFGDYDRETVEAERADRIEGTDETKPSNIKIITTAETQAAIMARVAILNGSN